MVNKIETLEPGDTVYLKSGSCRMTVERIDEVADGDGIVTVNIHVVFSVYQSHDIRRDIFPIHCVRKAN